MNPLMISDDSVFSDDNIVKKILKNSIVKFFIIFFYYYLAWHINCSRCLESTKDYNFGVTLAQENIMFFFF